MAEYRRRNRERINAKNTEWRKANPEAARAITSRRAAKLPAYREAYRATARGRATFLLSSARRNSKKRGHPAPDLLIEDLLPALEAGKCAVTGLPFVWDQPGHPRAPSLDRPDSSRPYQRDNFRVVLWAVNAGCGSWGLEEYMTVASHALGVTVPSTSVSSPQENP